ncbi:hypothetical protein FNV43_RR12886 [Rhamnella rubrinervis]|uniref:O-methyltransferase C-terminal domain-containing protein n=1 Tax=Rhamnella rubrinervis TaxID=2594499 RepID=A0A8K0H052_9ROSA|nr:hypothetical protein FNV43_RR12886 [Rhamnella rubrinervis]
MEGLRSFTLIKKALVKEENGTELLRAQAHIWNHILKFINSMSLNCATQLDEDDGEECYALTDASRLLVKDNPLSVTPFLLALLDPTLSQPWLHLSTWFQNDDRTPFETANGMALWEYAGHNPRFNNLFNDAMTSTGTLAKAIANEFPHMECTVFDLPHVVGDLEGSENVKYVGGDMFEAVPSADAVLLKCILHDWNDEECVKILGRCKEAITSKGSKKGKVIIIDMMVENHKGDEESTATQLCFDMLMMTLVTGRERSEKDWAKIFSNAGFRSYTKNPILGLRSLIEVYP